MAILPFVFPYSVFEIEQSSVMVYHTPQRVETPLYISALPNDQPTPQLDFARSAVVLLQPLEAPDSITMYASSVIAFDSIRTPSTNIYANRFYALGGNFQGALNLYTSSPSLGMNISLDQFPLTSRQPVRLFTCPPGQIAALRQTFTQGVIQNNKQIIAQALQAVQNINP